MPTNLFSCLLIVSGVLLSQCTTTKVAGVTTATTAPVSPDALGAAADTARVVSLAADANSAYQEVKIFPMVAEPANYTASVVCSQNPLGTLRLRVRLNPAQYALQELALTYALHNPDQSFKQVGDGTGHYDPKEQRYYFTVHYQLITKLSNGLTHNSSLYPVHGWVSTATNTMGLQL